MDRETLRMAQRASTNPTNNITLIGSIRSGLGLTQAVAGGIIGVKGARVSDYELGHKSLTEAQEYTYAAIINETVATLRDMQGKCIGRRLNYPKGRKPYSERAVYDGRRNAYSPAPSARTAEPEEPQCQSLTVELPHAPAPCQEYEQLLARVKKLEGAMEAVAAALLDAL